MGSHFRRNVVTTSGFFLIRFGVALIVTIAYIIVAAGLQYAVVGLLGESTFNYIIGGLLSLFLGALTCDLVGQLIFMFVRGWHVAALAYANKIRRSGAPAVTVGIKAFSKNIVGFAAVYGIRSIAKSLLVDFKDKLWELLAGVPLAENLQNVAENPVVEHLAKDVLNYGFDATIFYLVRNPPEDLDDVPSTVLEGLKKYLYCLPSIMITSVSSYILFRFLPKLCKWLTILWVLFTQGLCAGILLTVLMWPVFYILDNAFFSPLTMVMFISCFSKQCEEEIDENDPAVLLVNSVLEGVAIGTGAEDLQDVEPPEPPSVVASSEEAAPADNLELEPESIPAPMPAPMAVPRAAAESAPSAVPSYLPSEDDSEVWSMEDAGDTAVPAPTSPPSFGVPQSNGFRSNLSSLIGMANSGSGGGSVASGRPALSDLLSHFDNAALQGDSSGTGDADIDPSISGGDFSDK